MPARGRARSADRSCLRLLRILGPKRGAPPGTIRPNSPGRVCAPCTNTPLAAEQPLLYSRPVAKYDALRDYLLGLPRGQTRVTMTFAKVEEVLGERLPPSAHEHDGWWRGSTPWSRVVKERAWERGGWVVDDLNLRAKLVTFRRQD